MTDKAAARLRSISSISSSGGGGALYSICHLFLHVSSSSSFSHLSPSITSSRFLSALKTCLFHRSRRLSAELLSRTLGLLFRFLTLVGFPLFLSLIFTALHGMQTRSSDENSVSPSVCPSDAWIVTKCKKDMFRFLYHTNAFSLVFWEEESLAVGDPFYLKFWVNGPPLERNRRFWTDNHS